VGELGRSVLRIVWSIQSNPIYGDGQQSTDNFPWAKNKREETLTVLLSSLITAWVSLYSCNGVNVYEITRLAHPYASLCIHYSMWCCFFWVKCSFYSFYRIKCNCVHENVIFIGLWNSYGAIINVDPRIATYTWWSRAGEKSPPCQIIHPVYSIKPNRSLENDMASLNKTGTSWNQQGLTVTYGMHACHLSIVRYTGILKCMHHTTM